MLVTPPVHYHALGVARSNGSFGSRPIVVRSKADVSLARFRAEIERRGFSWKD